MGNEKRIYLSSPTMNGQEMGYIKEAFDTNWIAPLGANVNGFEQEMEEYLGDAVFEGSRMHAAALSAGTAAIHLALVELSISAGDIVFCSSLTFSGTCNPIAYVGATPVWIDSDLETGNMSVEALKEAFEKYPEVKAVITVNLYGFPAKLTEIAKLCKEHGVPLVEDAAESLGASYQGKKTGTFGEIGIFSFNGNKIITTSGGGMLLAKKEEYVTRARFLSTQAREPERHYEHKTIGYNYRMSNIVAGIGRGQLKTLDEYVQRKKKLYDTYKRAFAGIDGISFNPVIEGAEPNYWLTVMTLDPEKIKTTPNQIMDALQEENIESRPVWKPMHLQPVFKDYDFISAKKEADTFEEDSCSEYLFHHGVCLPSDIKNTKEDMERIISIIQNTLVYPSNM